MTEQKAFRPYNEEHALDGAFTGCRSPQFNPEILKRVGKNIYGIVHRSNTMAAPTIHQWSADTGHEHPGGVTGPYDLVMVPIDHIEGQPVYQGDVVYRGDKPVAINARQLPEKPWAGCTLHLAPMVRTRMTIAEFNELLKDTHVFGAQSKWNIIANGALARSLTDGDIVTRAEFDKAKSEASDLAARLAIAEKTLDVAGCKYSELHGWSVPAPTARNRDVLLELGGGHVLHGAQSSVDYVRNILKGSDSPLVRGLVAP